MKFKDLTGNGLIAKIQAQCPGIDGYWMLGTVFYKIHPRQKKAMNLKASYKPEHNKRGLFTEYHQYMDARESLKNQMQQKLHQNGFYGRHYFNEDAAFKLHISINHIAELDESIIQGLMELLIQESESPTNNMSFIFKFIDPQYHGDKRFSNTDQLTLYFDKYSSAADLFRLSQKIEHYLLEKGVPKNQMGCGPKDHFSFNSFVSARFDTNRLLGEYDVYKFIDLELATFLKKHPVDSLEIPLCALEAVFNTILLSDLIKNIHSEGPGLTDEESALVQKEFEQMLANPKAYLATTEVTIETGLEKQHAQKQLDKLVLPFIELLVKIDKKVHQLNYEGYPEKATIAAELHEKLNTEFERYQASPKSGVHYFRFNTACTNAIQEAKPHLKNHRGWNDVFFNLAVGIATLGTAFVMNYISTKGNDVFFKLNTDSVALMDKTSSIVRQMDGKNSIK